MKTAKLEKVGVEIVRTKRRRRRHSKVPLLMGSKEQTRHWVVQNATMSVAPGDCIFLLDPEGNRSAILMKVLTGLVPPDAGTVVHRGRSLMLTGPSRGWVKSLSLGQAGRLLGGMYGMTDKEIDDRIEPGMDFAGLTDKSWKPSEEFERRIIRQLAFSLGTAAPVKLLGLDQMAVVGTPEFRLKCVPRIRELMADGTSVVVIDRDPNLIPQLATRAIRVKRKKLVEISVAEAEDLSRDWAQTKRHARRRLRKDTSEDDEHEDFI